MWFIGVEVEQETSAPPPKKNPGSAPVNALSLITRESRSAFKVNQATARETFSQISFCYDLETTFITEYLQG